MAGYRLDNCPYHGIKATGERIYRKFDKKVMKNHIYWVMSNLGITENANCDDKRKVISKATNTGDIKRIKSKYTQRFKDKERYVYGITEEGEKAIENYLIQEGFKKKEMNEVHEVTQSTVFEQFDMLSKMKAEYDKSVNEKKEAQTQAAYFCELADKYEKELEELKDKLRIFETENASLKSEKQELIKQRTFSIDWETQVSEIQEKIGKTNNFLNGLNSDLYQIEKDVKEARTRINNYQTKQRQAQELTNEINRLIKRIAKS